jgi:hypothetical protein
MGWARSSPLSDRAADAVPLALFKHLTAQPGGFFGPKRPAFGIARVLSDDLVGQGLNGFAGHKARPDAALIDAGRKASQYGRQGQKRRKPWDDRVCPGHLYRNEKAGWPIIAFIL